MIFKIVLLSLLALFIYRRFLEPIFKANYYKS